MTEHDGTRQINQVRPGYGPTTPKNPRLAFGTMSSPPQGGADTVFWGFRGARGAEGAETIMLSQEMVGINSTHKNMMPPPQTKSGPPPRGGQTLFFGCFFSLGVPFGQIEKFLHRCDIRHELVQ